MEEFLQYVIGQLVEYPDEVIISKTEANGTLVFNVVMRQSDLGRIIGRGGHTIHALRTLLQAAAQKRGERVKLEIVE
jgi:predicted RNA-binding protein YlqC (UPF0109 family)